MSVNAAPAEFRVAFEAASEPERNDFLAYIFIVSSADGSLAGVTLAPQTQSALKDFVGRVGLDPAAPIAAQKQRVIDYFKQHPLSGSLLRAYAAVARELALDDKVTLASAHALVAVGAAKPKGVLDTGERPPNTTPGGTMARLAAMTGKFDKARR